MMARVAEGGEHGDVIAFRAGFFEYVPEVGDDDGVGGEDEGGFPGGGVDFGGVDGSGFASGGLEDVFEGGEGFREVFGEGGGVD